MVFEVFLLRIINVWHYQLDFLMNGILTMYNSIFHALRPVVFSRHPTFYRDPISSIELISTGGDFILMEMISTGGDFAASSSSNTFFVN